MTGGQPALMGAHRAPRRIARVAVDVPLAHLDRLFDYEIGEKLVDDAVVGARVQVRFSGQQQRGWIVELASESEVDSLAPLGKVISSEPLLTPETYAMVRAVADHYAGTFADVVRLAIPPRHAATEKAAQREWPEPREAGDPRVLPQYPAGASFLEALSEGRTPRALWQVAAVHGGQGDLFGGVVEAVNSTLKGGRSALVVVPTVRDLAAAEARLAATFGHGAVGTLSADAGQSARYRAYLAAARGQARVMVGTRAAMFAPLHDLGLIVVVDDGNDAHAEPRTPHPHTRSVAVIRAAREATALLLASHGRSSDAQALVERGWLGDLSLTPAAAREVSPPVRAVSEFDRDRDPTAARLRIPAVAFRFLRDHLALGPVLVQVPRVGHSASLRCARCRNLARCQRCSGPMRARQRDVPECSLCGFRPARWSCPHCHTSQLSTPLPGAARTAEELARAFPGVLAVNSSADRIRDEVSDEPAIVVATPGAEPTAPAGYAGALILDADVTLARADLRAGEEAVRRWSVAAGLVRAPREGGSVLIVGDASDPAVQAMVRTDLAGYLSRILADRADAGLVPVAKLARIVGDKDAVDEFLDNDEWTGVQVLGPTEVGDGQWAALLRAPLESSKELVRSVKHAAAIRSARKEKGLLSLTVDPETLD